jgi:integrase
VISAEEIALIRTVRGYSGKQARSIDRQRSARRLPTRVGEKKARPLILAEPQIRALKQQPDTPQGRRDALMICLLADHGLRVGELAALEVASINLAGASFSFYREKVHKTQTHRLSRDALAAATAYMAGDAPAQGRLLRGSRKNGALWGQLSERAIRERVRLLGERIGLVNLAPHDLRHTWATRAAARSDPFALRDAGGWNSLQMPNRYTQQNTVANERIDLGDEN